MVSLFSSPSRTRSRQKVASRKSKKSRKSRKSRKTRKSRRGGDYNQADYAKAYGLDKPGKHSTPKKRGSKEAEMYTQAFSGGKRRRKRATMKRRR